MKQFMELLNQKCTFVNGNIFYLLFSIGVVVNPCAVWLQAYKAWTAASTEGISLLTFIAILCLQVVGAGYAIRIKEPILFVAMTLSFLGSTAIVAAILIR